MSEGAQESAADEILPGVRIPDSAMRFQFARSGGPGGQNVNKLNTKAEIWVPVSAIRGLRDMALERLRASAGSRLTKSDEIHLAAEGERSQEGNRQDVMDRLRELIVRAKVEPKRRRKTKPSAGAKRCLAMPKLLTGRIAIVLIGGPLGGARVARSAAGALSQAASDLPKSRILRATCRMPGTSDMSVSVTSPGRPSTGSSATTPSMKPA